MKKAIILVGILSACIWKVNAQQEALYTQYMENQIYVNPAYAGSKEYLQLIALHRQQWVGFRGAPSTTSFSLHSPLKYQSLGLGIDVLNDKIGPLNRFAIATDIAYRLKFRNEGKLSLGVKIGLDSYSGNLRTLDLTGNDPLLMDLSNAITPTFGIGSYYFSPKWFVGASIPRLTKDLSKKIGGLDDATHGFAIAGCILKISDTWKLRPTTQLRLAMGAPMSVELSVAAVYNEKFWMGTVYRLKGSIGGLIQYQITPQFKFGYSYDTMFNGLRGYNNGSHEIMLSYGLIRPERGLVSPRYF